MAIRRITLSDIVFGQPLPWDVFSNPTAARPLSRSWRGSPRVSDLTEVLRRRLEVVIGTPFTEGNSITYQECSPSASAVTRKPT